MTGRRSSMTAAVGPRTVEIQSTSSSAFDTVADRQTSRTVGRQVDDDLLPHRPAVGVLQVVDLVEHDHAEAVERRRPPVDHVPQHLGGHHHDRRVAVDGVVAREEADLLGPVDGHQVTELLVREGLDRGRVEGPTAGGHGPGHGVLGHDGLARAGGRGDEDRLPAVQGVDGAELEVVEREAVPGEQRLAVGGHHAVVLLAAARASALARDRMMSRPMRIETS